MNYDMLMVLKKILNIGGINNIVNLAALPKVAVRQLSTQNVPYRK